MKRLSVAVALVCLFASAVPVIGAGKPLEQFHDRFEGTIPDDPTTTDDDLCGIPVTTTVRARQNGLVRLNQDGQALFKMSGTVTVTWTNEATSQSVQTFVAGQFRDLGTVENADGTTTIFNTNIGVAQRLRIPGGPVLLTDVGRIVFATTFDFGDPEDPEDDVFISNEIVANNGPHPDAESDFELFCEVVVTALT